MVLGLQNEMSDSFTTLLDVRLSVVAAKWPWMRFFMVGMDSARYRMVGWVLLF